MKKVTTIEKIEYLCDKCSRVINLEHESMFDLDGKSYCGGCYSALSTAKATDEYKKELMGATVVDFEVGDSEDELGFITVKNKHGDMFHMEAIGNDCFQAIHITKQETP